MSSIWESHYDELRREYDILDKALDLCIEEHRYDFYSNKERLLKEARAAYEAEKRDMRF